MCEMLQQRLCVDVVDRTWRGTDAERWFDCVETEYRMPRRRRGRLYLRRGGEQERQPHLSNDRHNNSQTKTVRSTCCLCSV